MSIKLGKRGQAGVALVSKEDYRRVIEAGVWTLHPNGYAFRNVNENGVVRTQYLHRFVLGLQYGDGLQVDHISGNRLDNSRDNLRICTAAENAQNKTKATGKSGFRGVSRYGKKWRASVTTSSGQRLRKVFASEIEAAEWAEEQRQDHQPFASPDPLLQTAS